MTKLSEQDVQQIVNDTRPAKEIAEAFGCTKVHVYALKRKHKTAPPNIDYGKLSSSNPISAPKVILKEVSKENENTVLLEKRKKLINNINTLTLNDIYKVEAFLNGILHIQLSNSELPSMKGKAYKK